MRNDVSVSFMPKGSSDRMEQQFDQLLGELQQVRGSKNDTFYEDHNNYYRGEVRRDINETSVNLLQRKGEEHLSEQFKEKLYGKPQ